MSLAWVEGYSYPVQHNKHVLIGEMEPNIQDIKKIT